MTAASPLIEYLTTALDRKLADLPSDERRTMFLAQAYGNWSMLFARFQVTEDQPFGGPHPVHGPMTAWDFRNLLCEIEKRQREIGRIAA